MNFTSIFEEANKEWKQMSAKVNWYTLIGDLYVARYPIKSGTTADLFKKSLYEEDDDVHAFDATQVRKKIIERMVTSEERGKIREWYTEVAFFCESMNFIRGIKEEVIDWVVRESLLGEGPFSKTRKKLVEKVDPETKIIIPSLTKEILSWCNPVLELYGFFHAMKKRLFIYTDTELVEIISFILDPKTADKYLRMRFVEGNDPTKIEPFLGQNHKDLFMEQNFMLKYLAAGDESFYKYRVAQIWLYSLFLEDSQGKVFLTKQRSNILNLLENSKSIENVLLNAIVLLKFQTVYSRLLHQLNSEYASKGNYPDYASKLNGILKTRNTLIERFGGTENFLTIELSSLDLKKMMIDIGVSMIEAVLKKLESQIPEPRGAGMKRTIMAKRKMNLRKFVCTSSIRDDIINQVLEIPNDLENITKKLALPANILLPRGEAYFKDLEEQVKKYLDEMGQLDLKGELKAISYAPQTLVKQYGRDAKNWLNEMQVKDVSLTELYASIMALKSSELLFDDATTTGEQKRTISQWILEILFKPQVMLTEELYQEYKEKEREKEKEKLEIKKEVIMNE